MTTLKGVGDSLAQRLSKLGVETVQDLLFLLPLRYEDRTCVVPIGSLRSGERAVVEGDVQLAEVVFRRRRQLLVRLADGSGFLTLRFFYFTAQQQQQLQRGVRLHCYGEARRGTLGLEIVHPEYRRADSADAQRTEDSLTPVYPMTEGIQQGRLRILTALALAQAESHAVRDWLPTELLEGEGIRSDPAWPLDASQTLAAQLRASLPFSPTGAQERALQEVLLDLGKPSPMLRLVQGDVGSGKTLVAALAALSAVEAGFQVALMAPTELLAEQHHQNFERWLKPLGLPVALLSGRLTGRARQTTLDAIAAGAEVPIVIGTHALFQEGVRYGRLALVIIDEQHRFGVEQRRALRDKGLGDGRVPHQLIMTATPIPRTLAMTAYADLDVSVIDELPPGRTPVKTVVLAETRRDEVVARIEAACREGRQAYWVCPLIEESDELDYQAAEATHAALVSALPNVRVGLVHGRLPGAKKQGVMAAFKRHEFDLLVATTVIEVGVDVPNASLMVIENAERMGLAQLHQLRGRVGRGAAESTCVLLYRAPLSQLARSRLDVMRSTNDGFEVSRRDLELRGPGEVLGTRQTGLLQLKVADLSRDSDLLPRVQAAAEVMIARHPDNIGPLLRRWIGTRDRYGRV